MTDLARSESVFVAAPAEEIYDLVADVTRTGEWSPICKRCEWEGEGGPHVGAVFIGHNEVPGRSWSTRSRVVAAERGREFAWLVGEGYVWWCYRMSPVDGGTELTESWEFRPEGIAMFHERYGDRAQAEIDNRSAAARDGIPRTLAAIKAVAEGGR
jgi:hypothetical protein